MQYSSAYLRQGELEEKNQPHDFFHAAGKAEK
jgi:hypothetical protein